MKYNKALTWLAAFNHVSWKLTFLVALFAGCAALSSCNEDSKSDLHLDTVNLAVKNFTLKSGIGNQDLDTVFFSIDLERGLIFNADSLRKGSDVSKVIANITFIDTPSEAIIEMSGGTTREGEIDYKKNPGDSIDFTGNVTLRLKGDDGKIATSYRIKVNVHNIDSDSLYWSQTGYAQLPSRMPNPKAQKTVGAGGETVSFIEESDGTFTYAVTDNVGTGTWKKQAVSFPFTPSVESLTATDTDLWILDNNGKLYTSPVDAIDWTFTGQTWVSLIGAYTTSVVGVKEADGTRRFAEYPVLNINESEVPADFPVDGMSNLVTLTNKWTSSPVAFFVGGRKSDGTLSGNTWAFDGANWIVLSSAVSSELEGASLVPYYHYRPNATGDYMVQYNVWMIMGGRKADGSPNRTVYISYDNGVNWTKANDSVQLPDYIPTMSGSDIVVAEEKLSANLSDIWKAPVKSATRAGWTLHGDIIEWDCPYIYIFGGYAPDGTLYDTIWRGVLSRLTFTPII